MQVPPLNLKAVYNSLQVKSRTQPTHEEEVLEEYNFVHPATGEHHSVSRVDFDFSPSDYIGKGSFGAVFKASYKGDQTDVAIKQIHKLDTQNARVFNREMDFLTESREWNCPNIVKYCGYIRHEKSALLIIELMDIDLYKVMRSPKFPLYQDAELGKSCVLDKLGYVLIRDITNGLRFAHAKKYMHRDIKPTNIMIDRIRRRLAIIDFGSTKKISSDSLRCDSMTPGADIYQAPECFNFESAYNESCDVWSLGISLIHFFTGTHPIWDDKEMSSVDSSSEKTQKDNTIVARICGKDNEDNEIDWEIALTDQILSDDFKSIINKCVDREAGNRPTAEFLYVKACTELQHVDKHLETEIFDTFIGQSIQ